MYQGLCSFLKIFSSESLSVPDPLCRHVQSIVMLFNPPYYLHLYGSFSPASMGPIYKDQNPYLTILFSEKY